MERDASFPREKECPAAGKHLTANGNPATPLHICTHQAFQSGPIKAFIYLKVSEPRLKLSVVFRFDTLGLETENDQDLDITQPHEHSTSPAGLLILA